VAEMQSGRGAETRSGRMIPQRGSSNCSGARTTYHNYSGGPKKCPLWPRFLRYLRQKKRFMTPV